MSELGDRLVILIVAATGLLGLIVGWFGGIVEAEAPGWMETALFVVLGLAFVAILAGIWVEFDRID